MKSATLVFLSHVRAFTNLVNRSWAYDTIELNQTQIIDDILIDEGVALVFLDGRHAQWPQQILAVKNRAATRRIPLCFVSDQREHRAEAVIHGADLALSWHELEARIDQVIADLARIPDDTTIAKLACECQQALPALAIAGVREFNRGEFYRQHDLFEALWVETAGPVRDLYRGILQIGVAYYQLERGNYRGALKMLQRSVQWLRPLPDVCQSLDIEALRRDSSKVRAELQRLGPERLSEFDRRLLKPVTRKPS